MCYVLFHEVGACYFVGVFAKNEKANLSAEDKSALKNWVEATRRQISGDQSHG